jgi:probable lipoprotein NlpC
MRLWRWVWLLGLTLSLAGCAGLRSQPRFRTPSPGSSPSQEVKPRGEKAKPEKEKSDKSRKAEERTKRKKDARRGGGLPSLRLFSKESSDLIETAENYLGTPYRYGGSDEDGMDCSGMVWRVVRDAWDKELPRNSAEMSKLGMPVSRGELEAGDLVFFATGGGRNISHVGIYGGDGRFIHSSTTQGVEWNTLEEGYWRRHLVCARRVSPESISP